LHEVLIAEQSMNLTTVTERAMFLLCDGGNWLYSSTAFCLRWYANWSLVWYKKHEFCDQTK
jgi:hypothetical protein